MKFSEIKESTVQDLRKRRTELQKDMFEAKMKNTLGQLANPLSIRAVRRDLARVETAIRAKAQV